MHCSSVDHGFYKNTYSGLHLGTDSMGGDKMRFYESKGGDGVRIHVHKHTISMGSKCTPSRKFLYFRLSKVASGTFSGTVLTSATVLAKMLRNQY